MDKIPTSVQDAMSDGDIKAAYERNADTNAFTDAEKTKLGNVPSDTTTALAAKAETSHTHTEFFAIAVTDESTDLTTGTAKVAFRMPYAFTLTDVRASVTAAPTGANLNVDINEGGVSILSTVLSIDAGEKTSTTATTPPVISDSTLADDAEITIDIDQIGSTLAGAGLKVYLIGTQ